MRSLCLQPLSFLFLILFAAGPAHTLRGQNVIGFPDVPGESSAGVGIALGYNGESIYAVSVMPNSPAAASKQIREGHRILAVGQGEEPAQSLAGKTIEDCVMMVRGPAGTQVRLTVVPEKGPPSLTREVILTRDELRDPLGLALDATLLEVGNPAPELRYVRVSDGKEASLAKEHRGQIVVVQFWATWSAPSHAAVAELQQVLARNAGLKDKVTFLTLCIDGSPGAAKVPALMEKIGSLVKEKKWTSTTHGWSSIESRSNWRIGALPTTYVIGADGKILASDPADPIDKVLEGLLKH